MQDSYKNQHKVRIAVFLILLRDNPYIIGKKQVLLQKRQNTGYMDNMYDACSSGRVEPNESILEAIQREAFEETCIKIRKEDIKLVNTYHSSSKSNPFEYLRFYFTTKVWSGEPKIGEPDKCSELLWVDIDNLPINTIPHFKVAINNFLNEISYDQDEF